MKKVLVVIDCQNDFITGSLRNEEAIKVVPNIVEKINSFNGDLIVASFDTHDENYLESNEGKKLPFVHCIKDTEGWKLESSIQNAIDEAEENRKIQVIYVEKPTFGSDEIPLFIHHLLPYNEELDIEFVGFCTDICVVSNVLITKSAFYNKADVRVDASCCAGVSVDKHNAALLTMRSCQVDIVNWADDPDLKKEN